jgi:hypothetical protein
MYITYTKKTSNTHILFFKQFIHYFYLFYNSFHIKSFLYITYIVLRIPHRHTLHNFQLYLHSFFLHSFLFISLHLFLHETNI